MKIIYLIAAFLAAGYFFVPLSAQEMLPNGGFETYQYNSSCAIEDFFVCHAAGWKMLNNTPDVIHSSNSMNASASHHPRTGNGNARFASPPNGMDEYMYAPTLSLTAGQTYVVSFWVRKDYATTANIPVGLHIGSSVPAPQVLPYVQTIVPQIKFIPTTTQYVRGSYCFTPTVNGVHYVTIGSFAGNGTGEGQVFLVDDVSVKVAESNEANAQAVIHIIQHEFCSSDIIQVDGTSSTGELEYEWRIAQQNGTAETMLYSSGIQSGQAGQFNISSAFQQIDHHPQKGDCYRVYLYAYAGCPSITYADFCIEKPEFSFINNGDPVCENELKNLQVNGQDNWTYSWSTGESGIGLKSINVSRPNAGTYPISVTITTENGCTATQSFILAVHSANNVAPTMDGINGTGEYTIYVRAGQTVNFSSYIYNNPYETVTSEVTMNISGAISNVPPLGSNQGTFTFNWSTPSDASGEYSFSIYLEDNNRCGFMDNTYTFRIIVICDHCPICVDYENRTPSHQPLPELTKAGKCITAGVNQPVKVGTGNNVTFRAGHSIELGAGFDTDGGMFLAEIDTSTCIDDCDDCCTAWTGFTYDEIPNGYTLNFADGDPTNDYFEVTDSKHPYCAFNAVGYSIRIYNQYNNNLYYKTETFSSCCAMQSASQDNPIAHSPVYWDGYTKNIWGSRVRPTDGTYFYEVHLYGCNGQEITKQGYLYVTSTHGMALKNEMDGEGKTALGDLGIQTEDIQSLTNITLSPNPTADFFVLSGIGSDTHYQLFDESGRSISGKHAVSEHQEIEVRNLPSGMYYCRIYLNDGTYTVRQFIKH